MVRTRPDGRGCICTDLASVMMRRLASLFPGRAFDKWLNLSAGSRRRGKLPSRAAAAPSGPKESSKCSASLSRSLSRRSLSMSCQSFTKPSSSESDIFFHHLVSLKNFGLSLMSAGVGSTSLPWSSLLQTFAGTRMKPRPRRYQKSLRPPSLKIPSTAPTQEVPRFIKNKVEAEKQRTAGHRSTPISKNAIRPLVLCRFTRPSMQSAAALIITKLQAVHTAMTLSQKTQAPMGGALSREG
mmetsp:Transcript_100675/g.252410  ORF Transcript_100675/g.252410 Transcript_100675/m.252410 type:complete len:240 (-) Transcript_100675:545-1264(-)